MPITGQFLLPTPLSSSATFGRKWRKKVPKEALQSLAKSMSSGWSSRFVFLLPSPTALFPGGWAAGLLAARRAGDEEGTLLDDSQKGTGKKHCLL